MPKRKPQTKIIGGMYKGTKIPYKPSKFLRPTENRVRETLFNWLMYDVEGSICLDMFSGTGALGLEALSRGAKKVIFLEKNRDLYERLKTVIEKLSLSERAKVIHADSIMYSYEKLNLEFDIIFLDPPFRKGLLNTVYNSLCKNKLFGKDSLIYVEAEEDLELSFMLWKEIKKTKVGQTQFVLYKNEG